VTKNAVSALDALGIDCVSIASDHIVDFPSDIIKNTIGMLEDDKIFVAGRENTPVYFQKDDKRVAIVSTNSVIIGTESLYKKEGISTYQADNLVKNIKEAKEAADVVIVDIHWGREYVYGVTDQMREIAMLAVDNGADLVIGSHALGVYPVVQYNGVPIIYSLGYFIGDSDLYLGKESFIFDISISKENKIEEIDMTPIYINDAKEVLLYEDYNIEKTTEILEQYNTWHLENSLESSIENNKIRIKF
jgi:poly-gamma-glutamate synthesis protein (capsule biosynthesis protein)